MHVRKDRGTKSLRLSKVRQRLTAAKKAENAIEQPYTSPGDEWRKRLRSQAPENQRQRSAACCRSQVR
jgi:hypothetical protein